MFELSKQFRFESAHTHERTINAEPSRRIHGRSYRAEVTVRGDREKKTGDFEHALAGAQHGLDHRFLDDVPDLGPDFCAWIWRKLLPVAPGLACVTVYKVSNGESCTYLARKR